LVRQLELDISKFKQQLDLTKRKKEEEE